jgi:hypothetical protein
MKSLNFLKREYGQQSLFTILLLTVHPSSAVDNYDRGATVSGELRLGAVSIDDADSLNAETFSIGGKLGYQSSVYRGVSTGITFYTSNPMDGYDEASLFLSSDAKGYSIPGEAYINVLFGETNLMFGRQEIDSPFADTDDIGMIPNTFEALHLNNTSLANTTLTVAYLHRWAGVDSEMPETFTRLNNDRGINVFGVAYQSNDKWNLQAWHYFAKAATDMSYLEANIMPSDTLQFGLQYASQHGGEFKGDVWGVSAEYTFQNTRLGAAYNQVSGGKVSNGFGGGPFFTSSEDHTVADVEDQRAASLSLEYTGIQNLTLGAYYVDFDKTENELDWVASVALHEAFTFDVIYSDMNTDGKMVRGFLAYHF